MTRPTELESLRAPARPFEERWEWARREVIEHIGKLHDARDLLEQARRQP